MQETIKQEKISLVRMIFFDYNSSTEIQLVIRGKKKRETSLTIRWSTAKKGQNSF